MNTRFPRSVYDKTGGIVYFARMVDKIRLHAANQLGKDYIENLGGGFDGRCCDFLGVKYEDLKQRVLASGPDDDLLQWCFEHGHKRTKEEINDWNDFMVKRGWRDGVSGRLLMRLKEARLEHRAGEILTMFDFIEVDEGREPPKFA
jgi:gluconokinase